MKIFSGCLLLFAAIGTLPALAEPISATDRQFAINHLKKTQKALEAAVVGLSEAQLKFTQNPDRWCIQQIAEHLALAEDNWSSDLKKVLERVPVTPEKKGQLTDDQAAHDMTDRSSKAQATGVWAPDGRWKSISEIMAHFVESRARMIGYVANTQEDLRRRVLRDGRDAYQYVLGVSYHIERHLQQVAEVKADPNYPK